MLAFNFLCAWTLLQSVQTYTPAFIFPVGLCLSPFISERHESHGAAHSHRVIKCVSGDVTSIWTESRKNADGLPESDLGCSCDESVQSHLGPTGVIAWLLSAVSRHWRGMLWQKPRRRRVSCLTFAHQDSHSEKKKLDNEWVRPRCGKKIKSW